MLFEKEGMSEYEKEKLATVLKSSPHLYFSMETGEIMKKDAHHAIMREKRKNRMIKKSGYCRNLLEEFEATL